MDQNFRLPDKEEYSDWNSAWRYAIGEEQPEVKHLAACIFGENDGPDWVWIFQLKDDSWAYLKEGCDYTGWDCQSGGSWKGGFKTAEEAIEAIPEDHDFKQAQKALLTLQAHGEKPYGLS